MITRFAPSPTGHLHLGHALAAAAAHETARAMGGHMLLRMEDIDTSRVREEYYGAIEEDLHWLGITWQGTPWRQLDRMAAYQEALNQLQEIDLIYPCFCTRKEIQAMTSAPQQGDETEALLYPGTCRELSAAEREKNILIRPGFAWRLHAHKAAAMLGDASFDDLRYGSTRIDANLLGDVVLARKDIGVAYHLAVVIDDAVQNVTHVTRGEDLLSSTHVHCLLQHLLGLVRPLYLHHELVCDHRGKRLAKRHDALSLRSMRAAGVSADEIMERLRPLLLRNLAAIL
jgi:glutamyl-Q tRNA(Asp) synthetase